MSYPVEKLTLKIRLIIYAVLFLLALGLHHFNESSGFWRGFAMGLVIAVILGELGLYLKRRSR